MMKMMIIMMIMWMIMTMIIMMIIMMMVMVMMMMVASTLTSLPRTGFKHIPCILGKEIDLYLLYWLVTSQGGWEKVNSRDGWDDLLSAFGLAASTTNGSLSLKQTYLRYLDAYEKYYFLGEEEDEGHDSFYDEEDTR